MLKNSPLSYSKYLLFVIFSYSFICSAGFDIKKNCAAGFSAMGQIIRSGYSYIPHPTVKQTIFGGISLGSVAIASQYIPLKNIVIGAASSIVWGSALYACGYWGNGKQIDSIERTLELSKNAQLRGSNENFKFCTWRQQNSGKHWQSAYDIQTNKDVVFTQLRNDAEKGALIVQDNKDGDITCARLIQAIENEQKELEGYLLTLDRIANVADLFIKKFTHFQGLKKTCQMSSLTNHQKICQCAPILMSHPTQAIDAVISQCKKSALEYNSYFIMPSYNPLSIKIAPRLVKAVNVYADVLSAYLRLLAIKDVLLESVRSR